MDKRRLKKRLKWLNNLKNWQLFLLLCLIMVAVATAWRLNNTQMLQRLDAVIAADEALDEGKIKTSLEELKRFSETHMNADTGLVSLVKLYERDSKNELNRVASLKQSDNEEYKAVYSRCDSNLSNSGLWWAYVKCWEEELAKMPERENLNIEPKFPPKELYEYSFVSPLWTPDFAGWATLAAILVSVAIILKMIFTVILKILLRKRLKKA